MPNQHRTETARAVLFSENNELVFIKRTKGAETYYVFVGGGRERVDLSLKDTLVREVREEIGAEISITGESEVFSFKEDLPDRSLMHYFFLATTALKVRRRDAEIDKPQDPKNAYELALFPALAAEIQKLGIVPSGAKEYLLERLPEILNALSR